MQYDFLKAFPRRMKSVGLYALLLSASGQKSIWKGYQFDTEAEQLNMDFAVLLFIMEQSLRELPCTTDDIGAFIDGINARYFHKPMTYEDCRTLGDYIINNILSNEGAPMYFDGFDFEESAWQKIHVSYVANRIIYLDQEVRRTSYYLTDDGYNLLLGTLEVENNMKLTIQEMIFRMHLEKQSYDQALEDIKGVFNLLRIQIQRIQEAMNRIRRNVLDYSVSDYEKIQEEDLDTITQTRDKFRGYRETVQNRVRELEERRINVHLLEAGEEDKLRNLREIETYLNRAIDEHQRILNGHFDLKSLYTNELEKVAEMSLVRRFSLRTELFGRIVEQPECLDRMDLFLHPLFNRNPGRILNLSRIFEPRRAIETEEEETGTVELDFDEEAWLAEQEERRRLKQKRMDESLTVLLRAARAGGVHLSEIRAGLDEAEYRQLVPDVDLFREIMVELLQARDIDIRRLRQERADYIREDREEFSLKERILKILQDRPEWKRIAWLRIEKDEGAEPVIFERVPDESGNLLSVRCTDVVISVDEGDTDGI
ncbi:MAG: hypothetical protein IJ088_15095 [Clostridia bacterium]|nr:hypothetical protein [Clostridia bacterium]